MTATCRCILVVDDDVQICTMLTYLLEEDGFRVETQCDTTQVAQRVHDGGVDLLVLDIAVGPVDGLTLFARLRQIPTCPPTVFLSGHDERAHRLAAFQLGALDYISKPCDAVELVARLRVAVRRGWRTHHPSRATHSLQLDLQRHFATRDDGTPVHLTPREVDLLRVLLDGEGHILTPDEMLERIWGEEYEGSDNIVTVYINRLRHKLDQPGEASCIYTLRGSGYTIASASTLELVSSR